MFHDDLLLAMKVGRDRRHPCSRQRDYKLAKLIPADDVNRSVAARHQMIVMVSQHQGRQIWESR
jgi:hypothetical protein